MKKLTTDINSTIGKHYLITPITTQRNMVDDDYIWLEKASHLQMRRWWKIRRQM